MKNTDTLHSLQLNTLREGAKTELARAINHALRCGVLSFEQCRAIQHIVLGTTPALES